MKVIWRTLLALFALLMIPLRTWSQQQNTFILESPSLADAQVACQKYGMTLVSIIHNPDTYLVQISASVDPRSLAEWTKDDPTVKHIEPNKKFKQSRDKGQGSILGASAPSSTYLSDPNLISIYGASSIVAYVQQPAFYFTSTYSSGVRAGLRGVGTIAVIDTGVDEQNPILSRVVAPCYDSTRDLPGYASDLGDIDQSPAHILHQSTEHIL